MATPARIGFWHDKQLGVAVMAAPIFWALLWWWSPPAFDHARPLREPWAFLLPALVYPVLEEIVFRGGLQTMLLGRRPFGVRRFGISGANLLTSFVFALFHLVAHAPLWAAAVFIPSLIFGYFRERHDSLKSPIALHVFYNAGYFWLFWA